MKKFEQWFFEKNGYFPTGRFSKEVLAKEAYEAGQQAALEQSGEVTITTNDRGECVAITRQNEDGQILSVIWEAEPTAKQSGEAVAQPCWSCKKPVSIAQRADSDGNCPNCNSELDDGWPAAATQHPVPPTVKDSLTVQLAQAVPDGWGFTFSRVLNCLEILDKRQRPLCRDCADECGTCPTSGLVCDMRGLIAEARALLAAAPEREDWPCATPFPHFVT